jgi:DNA-binding NarL/FixJ family response regulator
MISIVIYDDHKNRRDGLKLLISLEPDMLCLADFDNCVNIVNDLTDLMPDVILMDIDMPGMSGIEAVKLIRANYPSTLIIMQTVFDEDDKIFNSIRAGANGYYLKKTEPEKLIEGIREVVDGGAPMTASVARRILNFLNEQPETKANNTFNLSVREIEVLNFLVKGYSQKMIAAELNISRFTVNNHLAKIYEKLQVHNASEAVASAIRKKIINPGN